MVSSEADMLRLCLSFIQAQEWQKAWRGLNAVLDEYPDSPQALYLIGTVLRGQGHVGLALPVFGKALSLEQNQPNIWMHYGATLHDLNRWDDAIEVFKTVHEVIPDDPMPIANISASYVQKGKWNDAIVWADKALTLDPQHYIANISAGFACLGLGRWKSAWTHAEYMYGHQLVIRVYNSKENEEPQWDGTKGQTVVVQADQGVGDIIMFSQMLPQLQANCKEVIVETSERLVQMFKRNFPGVHVYGTLKNAGQDWSLRHKIDAHIHISFLGRFYRNMDSDFPRKAYLKPDPVLLEKWRNWLDKFERPYIGIAWRGGIQKTQKHIRSVEIDDYAPVIDIGGTFIDLSYHGSGSEVAKWNLNNKAQIVVPPINTANYDDTLALLAALTDVVTVTTTVAHACGAMGRSACVLVPEVPTWRYAYHCGDGMIWYPENSVRLFRRKHGETEWIPAINRIVKHLKGSTLKLCA